MPVAGQVSLLVQLVIGAVVWAMLAAWVWAVTRLLTGRRLLPEPRPRRVPWGIGSIFVVFLVYLTIQLQVGVVYRLLSRADHPGASSIPPRDMMLLISGINLLVLLILPQILRVTARATLADMGLTTRDLGRNVLRGLIACLLVAPVCYVVMVICAWIWKPSPHPMETMVRGGPSGPIALIAFGSAVLVAPMAEELMFRGILLGWFERVWNDFLGWLDRPSRDGTPADLGANEPGTSEDNPYLDASRDVRALEPEVRVVEEPRRVATRRERGMLAGQVPNLVTALFFAGVHAGQWPAPVPIFILSLALGELYRRTGSLVGPVTLHAAFNGLSTSMLFLVLLTGPPGREPEKAVPPPATPAPTSVSRGVVVPCMRITNLTMLLPWQCRSRELSFSTPIGAQYASTPIRGHRMVHVPADRFNRRPGVSRSVGDPLMA